MVKIGWFACDAVAVVVHPPSGPKVHNTYILGESVSPTLLWMFALVAEEKVVSLDVGFCFARPLK